MVTPAFSTTRFSAKIFAACSDQPANDVDWTNCNFVESLELTADFHNDNNSVVIYNNKHRISIAGGSSYILINDHIFHLYNHVIYTNKDYLIPAFSFIRHIADNRIIDNITLDSMNKTIFIGWKILFDKKEEKYNNIK